MSGWVCGDVIVADFAIGFFRHEVLDVLIPFRADAANLIYEINMAAISDGEQILRLRLFVGTEEDPTVSIVRDSPSCEVD